MKRSFSNSTLALAMALALAALAIPAGATMVIERSNQDLARSADLIAVGQAMAVESTRHAGEIMTRVTVEVDELWKGSAGSQVSFLIPGGVDLSLKHPVTTTYPGAPQVLQGQEVVLFLTGAGDTDAPHRIVGFSQGIFWISRQEDGGARVSRNLSELRLLGPDGVRHGGRDTGSLGALRQEVQSYLQEGGTR